MESFSQVEMFQPVLFRRSGCSEGYFPAETFREVYPSAGMPTGRVFAEGLKLMKDFSGYSLQGIINDRIPLKKVIYVHRQSMCTSSQVTPLTSPMKYTYFFLPIMPVNKKPVKQFTIYLTGLSLSLYFNYSAAASSTLSAESAGASTNSVIPLFTKILYHEISFLISPL